jgi:glycosyltransferase involved in cell wall biosynthesis
VDDGSTDQTGVICAAAATRDSRVRLFRSQGTGPAAARNSGISYARGELIATLDHDDLWHPEKIARQVKVMQTSSPKVGLVYCWSVHIDENDYIIASVMSYTAQGCVTLELAKGNFIHTSSTPLIKRSCINAVGGYDTTLQPHGAEDWKLYLALSEICEFAVLPEYLVGYRQWSGGTSRNVAGMAQSTENVARWLSQKRPDIPYDVKRQRIYNTHAYLAEMSLDTHQLVAACWHRARACQARPEALFQRSSFNFGIRLLARILGIERRKSKGHGRLPRSSVLFQDFESSKTN